jgi:toxin FitB
VFLLDSNVISELRDGKPQQSQLVRAWANQQMPTTLFLCATVVLELERGIQLLERRTPTQGQGLRRWLHLVLQQFEGRILPFNVKTAPICARLHVANPRSERDAMIAAVALEHRFAMVTRNTQDFVGAGLTLINPWLPID